MLMNARFEPQQCEAMASGVLGEVIEHQLAKARAPKVRVDVHTFDLGIVAKSLQTSAARGCAVVADEKEGHILGEQFLYAIAMPALGWIKRCEMRFELVNQGSGIGAVGAFLLYLHGHRFACYAANWGRIQERSEMTNAQ